MKTSKWQYYRKQLEKSKQLAFEWSIKLKNGVLEERDKLLCWVGNESLKASEEINFIRFQYPNHTFLESLANKDIRNIGVSLAQGDETLYIHYIDTYKRNRYRAFKDKKQQTYDFYYLPCTPEAFYPEIFLKGEQRDVYLNLLEFEDVKAMSGFWLRKEEESIQQISLLLPHRSTIRYILHILPNSYKSELSKYQDCLIKYVAFNEDDSLTLYFSAKLDHFPETCEEAKKSINVAAKEEQTLIRSVTKNISNANIQHNAVIDDFYSTTDIEAWKKILGSQMYYHFGLFNKGEVVENIWDDAPFERAMKDICKHIDDNEKVYDLGCGYGAVSNYLMREKNCDVLAATISKTQFQYCSSLGIKTRYTDMESTFPPTMFDTILLYESFENVMNKLSLLKKLKRFTKKLVIRCSTSETGKHNIVFDGSMNLIRSDYIMELLVKEGYRIKHVLDRRDETMQTFEIWKKRIDAVYIENDQHYTAFKGFVNSVLTNVDEWQKNHRFIDIIAYTR